MTSTAVLLLAVAVCLLLILLGLWAAHYYKQDATATQRIISDADLIELFAKQPDGLLSPHQTAELTGLTLWQARRRLTTFYAAGILHMNYNKMGRYFYSLIEPYRKPENLSFSTDPFLTVEDLLQLFAEDPDGRLTMQEMVLSTKLPIDVLKREMKHFEKESIIQQLYTMSPATTASSSKCFVLQEPYRSDPTKFREKTAGMDLELKELLRNEDLIV